MPRYNVFATLTHVPRDLDWESLDTRLVRTGESATLRNVVIFSGLQRLLSNQREADARGIIPAPRNGDLLDNQGRVVARQSFREVRYIIDKARERWERGWTVKWIDMVSLRRLAKGQLALNADRWYVGQGGVSSAHALRKGETGREGVDTLGMPLSEYDFTEWDFLIVDFEEEKRVFPRVIVTDKEARVESKGEEVIRHKRTRKRTVEVIEEIFRKVKGKRKKRVILGDWRVTKVHYRYDAKSRTKGVGKLYKRLFIFHKGRLVANVPDERGSYGRET